VLNLTKTLNGKALVDFNICRLVVPAALIGTLIGVIVNSLLAPWLIVALLVLILIVMTLMVTHKFYEQYREEQEGEIPRTNVTNPQEPLDEEAESPPRSVANKIVEEAVSTDMIERTLLPGEGFGAAGLLLLTIACGVLRHHAVACASDIAAVPQSIYGRDACERPVTYMIFGSLAPWVDPHSFSWVLFRYGTVVIPMMVNLCAISGYSRCLVKSEGWQWNKVLSFCSMGVFTGCFAGLVGIGGGLVFSPFILWMAVDPATAVATSSTLVIFTSSSTTFQYLLNDRIVLSLTLIYGLVNLVASYMGTSGVHKLQDEYHTRRSFITGIVAFGVIASVILSVYKLVSMGVMH